MTEVPNNQFLELVGARFDEVTSTRVVGSAQMAMWEVEFSRLMSSQSASRVLIVSRATSIRVLSTSESRLPSAWNCSSRSRAQSRSAAGVLAAAAARAAGSSWAMGSRSPTIEAARDSRLAAGWEAPVSTVAAAIRSAVAWVCKPALVPLPPAVGRGFDRAIADRDSGALLRSRTGTRMDRHCATRRLRALAATARISTSRMHSHMLRHTYVTTVLDAGVDLRDVQISARHTDPRTMMRYDPARKDLDRHPNYILAASWHPEHKTAHACDGLEPLCAAKCPTGRGRRVPMSARRSSCGRRSWLPGDRRDSAGSRHR